VLGAALENPAAKVEPSLLEDNPEISLRWVRSSMERLRNVMEEYRSIALERERYEQEARAGRSLEALIFGPYLLAFAFALRATKTTGELFIARRKAKGAGAAGPAGP